MDLLGQKVAGYACQEEPGTEITLTLLRALRATTCEHEWMCVCILDDFSPSLFSEHPLMSDA